MLAATSAWLQPPLSRIHERSDDWLMEVNTGSGKMEVVCYAAGRRTPRRQRTLSFGGAPVYFVPSYRYLVCVSPSRRRTPPTS